MKLYKRIGAWAAKGFLASVLILHLAVTYAQVKLFTPPTQCSGGACDHLPGFTANTPGVHGDLEGGSYLGACDHMQLLDDYELAAVFNYGSASPYLFPRFAGVSACATATNNPACKFLLANNKPAWSNGSDSIGRSICTCKKNCSIFNIPAPVKRISLYFSNQTLVAYAIYSTNRGRLGTADQSFPAGMPATPFIINHNTLEAGQNNVLLGGGALYDGSNEYNIAPFADDYSRGQDKKQIPAVAYNPEAYNIEFIVKGSAANNQDPAQAQPIGLAANGIALLQIANDKAHCFPNQSKLCKQLRHHPISYTQDDYGNKSIHIIIANSSLLRKKS